MKTAVKPSVAAPTFFVFLGVRGPRTVLADEVALPLVATAAAAAAGVSRPLHWPLLLLLLFVIVFYHWFPAPFAPSGLLGTAVRAKPVSFRNLSKSKRC